MAKSFSSSESSHLKKFMDFKQSTHLSFVSNSVGMALLHLSKIYLSPDTKELEAELTKAKNEKKAELSEEEENAIQKKLEQAKLDNEYTKCITELVSVKKSCLEKAAAIDAELKADKKDDKKSENELMIHKQKLMQDQKSLVNKAESINNIIKITRAELQQWDKLTLYLPGKDSNSYQNTESLFPLKKVITLIWRGLHDDQKFIHAYAGLSTLDENLNKAHQDQEFRLESFYNTIEKIRINQLCSQGNRNELVFSLNKTYEGIDIVEDDLATILSILKQKIHDQFWEKYNDKKISDPEKNELQKLLFNWMTENKGAKEIFEYLQLEKDVEKILEDLYLRNGINPKSKEHNLKDKIKEALSFVEFSSDPGSILFKVNAILNFAEDAKYPYKNAMLTKIKNWLSTGCDLNFAKNKEIILQMERFLNLHSDLIQAIPMFTMLGKEEQVKRFKQLFEQTEKVLKAYSDKIELQNVSFDTEISDFYKEYQISKKDNREEFIRDFFAAWKLIHDNFARTQNATEAARFMSTLHSYPFYKIIFLNDANIEKIYSESKLNIGEITLTPYIVNRMFLHALLTHTQDWSDVFYKRIKETIEYVEQKLTASDTKTSEKDLKNAAELIKSSYPKVLLNQIKNLINKRSPNYQKPTGQIFFFIRTPECSVTFDDWYSLFYFLNEEVKERLYSQYKIFIANTFIYILKSPTQLNFEYLKIFPKNQLADLLLKIEKTIVETKNSAKFLTSTWPYLDQLPSQKAIFLLHCSKEMLLNILDSNNFRSEYLSSIQRVIDSAFPQTKHSTDEKPPHWSLNLQQEERFNVFKLVLSKVVQPEKFAVRLISMLSTELDEKQKWELFSTLKSSDYNKAFGDWFDVNRILIKLADNHKNQMLTALGPSLLNSLVGKILDGIVKPEDAFKSLLILNDLKLVNSEYKKYDFTYFKLKLKEKTLITAFVKMLDLNQVIGQIKNLNELNDIVAYLPEEYSKVDFIKKVLDNLKNNKQVILFDGLAPSIVFLKTEEQSSILKPLVDEFKNEKEFIDFLASKPADTKPSDTKTITSPTVKLQDSMQILFQICDDSQLKKLLTSWRGFITIVKELKANVQNNLIKRLGKDYFLSLSGNVIGSYSLDPIKRAKYFALFCQLNNENILPIIPVEKLLSNLFDSYPNIDAKAQSESTLSLINWFLKQGYSKDDFLKLLNQEATLKYFKENIKTWADVAMTLKVFPIENIFAFLNYLKQQGVFTILRELDFLNFLQDISTNIGFFKPKIQTEADSILSIKTLNTFTNLFSEKNLENIFFTYLKTSKLIDYYIDNKILTLQNLNTTSSVDLLIKCLKYLDEKQLKKIFLESYGIYESNAPAIHLTEVLIKNLDKSIEIVRLIPSTILTVFADYKDMNFAKVISTLKEDSKL